MARSSHRISSLATFDAYVAALEFNAAGSLLVAATTDDALQCFAWPSSLLTDGAAPPPSLPSLVSSIVPASTGVQTFAFTHAESVICLASSSEFYGDRHLFTFDVDTGSYVAAYHPVDWVEPAAMAPVVPAAAAAQKASPPPPTPAPPLPPRPGSSLHDRPTAFATSDVLDCDSLAKLVPAANRGGGAQQQVCNIARHPRSDVVAVATRNAPCAFYSLQCSRPIAQLSRESRGLTHASYSSCGHGLSVVDDQSLKIFDWRALMAGPIVDEPFGTRTAAHVAGGFATHHRGIQLGMPLGDALNPLVPLCRAVFHPHNRSTLLLTTATNVVVEYDVVGRVVDKLYGEKLGQTGSTVHAGSMDAHIGLDTNEYFRGDMNKRQAAVFSGATYSADGAVVAVGAGMDELWVYDADSAAFMAAWKVSPGHGGNALPVSKVAFHPLVSALVGATREVALFFVPPPFRRSSAAASS